jgi:hypothetical protein
MESHMISLALISLPDNLSVSNDSASSHARVSDRSRASIPPLVFRQATSDVGSLTVAQFRKGLSQREDVNAAADHDDEIDQWRLESNLRGLNNNPEDHDLSPEDRDGMLILTESQKYDDCVGAGPPLYNGKPLEGGSTTHADVAFTTRPRTFLDIDIDREPAGRLVFELFTDQAPRTCEKYDIRISLMTARRGY